MAEQRELPRTRTLLPARISFNGGRSVCEAVVRDLSAIGARLAVSEGITLPETFRLHLTKTDEWHVARLCWRRAGLAGVRFEPADRKAAEGAHDAAAARRIRDLEAEVTRLRRVLEELKADPGRAVQILERAG